MAGTLTVRGIVNGNQIELDSETGLPSGTTVMVTSHTAPLTLEQKRVLVDELCGTWADDSSVQEIFAEIARERHDALPRNVEFDAAS